MVDDSMILIVYVNVYDTILARLATVNHRDLL